ncbi:MAG: zinc ribbon domain-containing protein [Nitrospirae bacterium]|nr:zinc ribbon domain-containing protein [Nitrospirota bacterium]
MPIFEYHCQECKEEFEKLVSNANKTIEILCPKCSSKNVKKKFSVFGMGGVEKKVGSSGSNCGTCSSSSCSTCR